MVVGALVVVVVGAAVVVVVGAAVVVVVGAAVVVVVGAAVVVVVGAAVVVVVAAALICVVLRTCPGVPGVQLAFTFWPNTLTADVTLEKACQLAVCPALSLLSVTKMVIFGGTSWSVGMPAEVGAVIVMAMPLAFTA